jgi:(p)ppGpp synthase/HD superfamily hydrolase
MESILEQVKDFADQAHGEQTRKYTPERYIVHPVRVMEMVRQYKPDITLLAAALLHDVLEDTPVNKQAIKDFLDERMPAAQVARTIQLVEELTDVYVKANYPHWNRRKRKAKEMERMAQTSADAQTIKYADIIDNCSEIAQQDPEFAKVFLRECKALLGKMDKGNRELYGKAIELVEGKLKEIANA